MHAQAGRSVRTATVAPVDALLVTCAGYPAGEYGAHLLDAELARRGVTSAWVAWDDPAVDWGAADVIAVRATWDYAARLEEFLAWSGGLGPGLLNGHEAFVWNTDKGYLVALAALGVPTVPTIAVRRAEDLAAAIGAFGEAVVKPAVGAEGRGVQVAGRTPGWLPEAPGPWVVQPLVESVRTLGERSVFVIDGRAYAEVLKATGDGGDIRVHEQYGGSYRAAELDPELARLAEGAFAAAGRLLGRPLDYARVDFLHYRGRWLVSELEATEPGLYLGLCPGNAAVFAELVADRVAARGAAPRRTAS